MLKYGLDMASAGPAGDALTMGELAHIAEESGWDGIFLEDYIIWQCHPDVPTYDPWITLAAMAMRTQQIRLGTMVTHRAAAAVEIGAGACDARPSVERADDSWHRFG